MKLVKVVPRLYENVLQDVVGIVMVEHHAAHLPVELFAIQAHHLGKGRSAALRVGKLALQVLFVSCHLHITL